MSEITMLVPLYGRKGLRAFAKVDLADYPQVAGLRWHMRSGYAERTGLRPEKPNIAMHRQLLGLIHGDGLQADHINRDRKDNRRSNLRLATNAENMQNQSPGGIGGSAGFRGVSRHSCGKWQAYAAINGRQYYLGLFTREASAAAAAAAFRAKHMPFSPEARVAS